MLSAVLCYSPAAAVAAALPLAQVSSRLAQETGLSSERPPPHPPIPLTIVVMADGYW